MRMRAMGALGLSAATALTAAVLSPVTATAAPVMTTGISSATATISAAAAPAKPRAAADFNGDGYPDLAISARQANARGVQKAGAVAVAYGSATGIDKTRTRLVTQADEGVPGDPVASAEWGGTGGYGDLDRDGFDDLIVWGGSVAPTMVLWGSASGLSGGTVLDYHDRPDMRNWSLHTVADVDGDGSVELVGKSEQWSNDLQKYTEASFTVVRGPIKRDGTFRSVTRRETLKQDGVVPGALTVGDFTGDGRPDIAAIDHSTWRQELLVYRSTATGWTASRQLSLPGTRYMWMAPVVGDINGDGAQDMVLGHRWTLTDALGKIFVVYGGKDGFSTALKPRLIDEDTPGVPGALERFDRWGEARSLADIDKDGYADLAVGAPYKSAQGGTIGRAGSLTVLRGGKQGLTTAGARTITQNTAGVPSSSERNDRFGEAVAWVDGDRNGTPELYVGGPGEDTWVGRVWQLPAGGTTGVTSFNLKETGHPSGLARLGETFTG